MADDFKELLKAQQQTTEMLRLSMMTAEEREAERAAAEARRAAMAEAARKGWETRRSNAEKENNDAQDATTQAIQSLTDQQKSIADAERGNRAKADETASDAQANENKNRSLLGKIAGGITTLKDNAINTAKKAGKTGLAILSGIAFGALLYAFGEFLQSDTFKDLTNYLTGPDGLLKRLSSFDISFGEGAALLGVLLGGVALAFKASALTKLFGPIKLAVKGITAGLGSLGTRLGGVANNLGGKGGSAPAGGRGGARVRGGGALGKVGSSIASVGKGVGAGAGALLKGMAGGLAAIANPATLAGLAAVTLAINGIAAAVRIASPAFEPFGKLLESAGETIKSVFEGLGSTIESIGKSVKGIIGSIAEGITNILTKISEARTAGVRAKTEQIQQLSSIDPGTIESTARGITLMKNALEGFGSESFGNVIKGLISDGPVGDILKLAEKHEILNKAANAVMAITASGMSYKQIMDEEKRQSRIKELEGKTRFGPGAERRRQEDAAELAKLRAQGPAPELEMLRDTAGQRTRASMQGMFTADPRVEAMITSAINKSKIATQGVTVNNVSNNTDNRNQSQNTQQQVGAPLTNAKYPRLAYGTSRDF